MTNDGWYVLLPRLSKVELVNDARRDSLMLLTEEEQHAVRASREDVNDGVGVGCFETADHVRNLLSERCGMPPTCHALLARGQSATPQS